MFAVGRNGEPDTENWSAKGQCWIRAKVRRNLLCSRLIYSDGACSQRGVRLLEPILNLLPCIRCPRHCWEWGIWDGRICGSLLRAQHGNLRQSEAEDSTYSFEKLMKQTIPRNESCELLRR